MTTASVSWLALSAVTFEGGANAAAGASGTSAIHGSEPPAPPGIRGGGVEAGGGAARAPSIGTGGYNAYKS